MRPLNDWERALVEDFQDMDEENQEHIIAQFGNDIVYRRSLATLLPGAWLNDDIINAYMQILNARVEERPQRTFFSTSNFVRTLLQVNHFDPNIRGTYNFSAIGRRWRQRLPVDDIFHLDRMILPVHVHGNHWTLADVRLREHSIHYHDPLLGNGDDIMAHILHFIRDEYARLHSGSPLPDEWTLVGSSPDNTPQQGNHHDCGVFVCIMADCLQRDHPLKFTQQQLGPARDHIALSIIVRGDGPHWQDQAGAA
jgi:sentrin-specific protease 1